LSFDDVLGLNNLGYTCDAGPPEGGDLPEDGTLYARQTKLKSQTWYKKYQKKGRVAYHGF
jgi:hypothetical protein